MPQNHRSVFRTHVKGDITPYRACLNLCKLHGLDPSHLRAIRNSRGLIAGEFAALWELLHDQIVLLTAPAAALEFEKIEKSRVLDQLRQKIPVSHISRLVGDFLKPSTAATLAGLNYAPMGTNPPATFHGLGVVFNGTYRDRSPAPARLLEALDYFKIQYFHRPNDEQYQTLMQEYYM